MRNQGDRDWRRGVSKEKEIGERERKRERELSDKRKKRETIFKNK